MFDLFRAFRGVPERKSGSGLLALSHLSEPGEGVGHICAFVPGVAAALRQIEAWRAVQAEGQPR